ncbi:hypothetical protein RI129_010501 [Pyrocoelia pectoralis]|uniref:Mitochondrial 2-oxoglutarate/malate carrier protein n=1 Tax=Pyrocoelia pectoralis TaxID=417401 RepID=A0AAN7VDJ7_9COLE
MTLGDPKPLPVYTKFLFAATSGVAATLVCYPLDLVKNRMQVYGKTNKGKITAMNVVNIIRREHGFLGLYKGLGASVVRQTLYTGTRMGLYQAWLDYINNTYGPPNLLIKCGLGIVSGAAGGIAGLPPDVALTRISTDDLLPPDKRRNYRSTADAITRMYKEEGPSTLFLGFTPVVLRAIILNTSQIVSYYQIKEAIMRSGSMEDNTSTHIVCSMLSAFLTTCVVLPMDMSKTRMQNMRIIDGKPEYNSLIHVLTSVIKQEGPLALWSGFAPLLIRNGPQFIVIFVVYERCVKLYRQLM